MATEFPNSFRDPLYASLDAKTEEKLGLPVGLLSSVRANGEKSNHNQTNELGTLSVYQFIPATRKAILDKYGIDVSLSPENASEGAGLLLKEGLDRNKGDASQAVGEYIGGLDRKNWGKTTNAYINRVMTGQQGAKVNALENGFAQFMAKNPAVPAGQSTAAASPAAPAAAPKPDAMSEGFGNWLAKENSGKVSIPGAEAYDARPPTPDATLGEQIVGAGETALNLGTGMVGGTLGAAVGAGSELVNQLTSPTGSANPMQAMSNAAEQGAQALTYAPRTAAGQDMAAGAGSVLANAVPLAGLGGEMASLARAGQVAKPTAAAIPPIAANTLGAAAENVAAGVRAAPAKVAQLVGREPATPTPTPGTFGSVGAAGVDMATQRRMNAADLPAPIQLTKGQAERSFEQQRFERETAKNPEAGAPLRERFAEQNQQVLRNFDAWVDQTGAEAPDLRATGVAVDKALVSKAARDKAEIRVAYKNAEKAGEMAEPVNASAVADVLNASKSAESTAPVLSAAKAELQRLGGGTLDEAGNLVGTDMTLGNMEQLRRFVNKVSGADPTNIKFAADIKRAIDASTEGAGGDLYRGARRLRENYANQYENRAVIAKLLNTKRGTNDRQVAFEDVFDHSILRGSLDDVKTVRKVLQTGDADGKQAWKELQGQTVNYIKDQATKNVARDERGNQIVSAAGLDKAIRSLDADGKLDFVFGKKGAEQMRAINDLAKDIYTAPPGSVNTSNTASVLLAAMDMAISGAGGMPLPVMSGLRMVVNNVKDRRIRAQVNEALGLAARREAAQPKPIRVNKKTIH